MILNLSTKREEGQDRAKVKKNSEIKLPLTIMLDILAIKIVFFFYKTTEDLMPCLSFGEEDILEKIRKIHLFSRLQFQCSWILRTHGANNLMASIRP